MSSRLDALNQWVLDVARLTRPEAIHWCDGSDSEYDALVAKMQDDGTLLPLNPDTHPNSWLHRSHPDDVARVEHLTFVCTPSRTTPARTTTGWRRPMATHDGCAVRRLHAGPHDVRDPLLHGPDRLAVVALRRGDHRQRRTWSPTCGS
jgi:GTP-dependent phosphoenolpyruvate carboxykinase